MKPAPEGGAVSGAPSQPKDQARHLPALYLGTLSLLAAIYVPPVFALQAREEIALGWWTCGAGILTLGAWRTRRLWAVVGIVTLWALVCVCIVTQLAEFGAPPGRIWGQRGLGLTAALLAWMVLLRPPALLWRGSVAAGLVTGAVLVFAWLMSPPVGRTVSFSWLAVDSTNRLYAAETDLGVIWVFDADGTRSNLWPRRAVPGQPGPGLQPAGFGSELLQPVTQSPANNSGLTDANLTFCGIAVDAQDQLYMVDAGLHEVRRFTRDGQLADAWKLPDYYGPARGCVAAGGGRVFVSDGRNVIHVFGADGSSQAHWSRPQTPRGLALGSEGLWVLQQTDIAILDVADGSTRRTQPLSKPAQGLAAPYQALVFTRGGGFLVSDANLAQVRRFAADGSEQAPLGKAATWAGQFAGAGGWPGEFAAPSGAAEDMQGRIYVADSAFRVIQRFGADGVVDAVYSVPESEANDMRRPFP
jgi:hypothetical protein